MEKPGTKVPGFVSLLDANAACVAGGLAYWGLSYLGMSLYITVIVAFSLVCAIRLLAVRYHISLPKLRDEEQTVE